MCFGSRPGLRRGGPPRRESASLIIYASCEDVGGRIDVFFYGLFMDEALLRAKGLRPGGRRVASVEGFGLLIGERATLVPRAGSIVYGVIFSLTRGEVDALYTEASVSAYRPETVSARAADGSVTEALCYNLPAAPSGARDRRYAAKLRGLARRAGLPADYVSSIK